MFILFIAPEEFVKNVSGVVLTNSTDILVTWEPLPADPEIWNFEDLSGAAYFAQFGVYEVHEREVRHTKELLGPFFDATFLKNSMDSHVLYTFEITAFSEGYGPYSPPHCLMLPTASKLILFSILKSLRS